MFPRYYSTRWLGQIGCRQLNIGSFDGSGLSNLRKGRPIKYQISLNQQAGGIETLKTGFMTGSIVVLNEINIKYFAWYLQEWHFVICKIFKNNLSKII
jgi:hypothetical protein